MRKGTRRYYVITRGGGYRDNEIQRRKYRRSIGVDYKPRLSQARIDIKTTSPYTTLDYLKLQCPDVETKYPGVIMFLKLCSFPELVGMDSYMGGVDFPLFKFTPDIIMPRLNKDEYYRISSKNCSWLSSLDGTIVKVVKSENLTKDHLYRYTLRVSCTDRGRWRPKEIIVFDHHGKHEISDIFIPITRKEN